MLKIILTHILIEGVVLRAELLDPARRTNILQKLIYDSLNKMCANRTTIIVAHRLSTIILADEIVERGKHEHLIGQEGIYANMWKQQLDSREQSSAGNSLEKSTA